MSGAIPEREVLRKTIHILFGTGILLIIGLLGTETSKSIIALFLFVGVIASILIMRGYKLPFLQKMVEKAERESEKNFPGRAAVHFFVSALLLLVLFQDFPTMIMAALSVQVFADTAAAIVGMKYGKHKLIGKKTLEGSMACFIVSVICINFFFNLPLSIAGAIIATIIELLPLDDNFWVPLFTATTIRLLS